MEEIVSDRQRSDTRLKQLAEEQLNSWTILIVDVLTSTSELKAQKFSTPSNQKILLTNVIFHSLCLRCLCGPVQMTIPLQRTGLHSHSYSKRDIKHHIMSTMTQLLFFYFNKKISKISYLQRQEINIRKRQADDSTKPYSEFMQAQWPKHGPFSNIIILTHTEYYYSCCSSIQRRSQNRSLFFWYYCIHEVEDNIAS